MVLCLFALALLLALAVLLFSHVLMLHTNDADDGNFFADYPWVLVVLTVVATSTALLPVARYLCCGGGSIDGGGCASPGGAQRAKMGSGTR